VIEITGVAPGNDLDQGRNSGPTTAFQFCFCLICGSGSIAARKRAATWAARINSGFKPLLVSSPSFLFLVLIPRIKWSYRPVCFFAPVTHRLDYVWWLMLSFLVRLPRVSLRGIGPVSVKHSADIRQVRALRLCQIVARYRPFSGA